MFSRIIIFITTIFASILLTNTPANANSTAIAALTTSTMMQGMQEVDAENQRQAACIALAVYHEALNQGDVGQRAVVHVILNRVKSGRFADTPCGVVFQRGQFSFVHYPSGRLIPRPNETWFNILHLVMGVQNGETRDPTSGAMFFYNPKIARPAWRHVISTVRIGAHIFVVA